MNRPPVFRLCGVGRFGPKRYFSIAYDNSFKLRKRRLDERLKATYYAAGQQFPTFKVFTFKPG